MAEAAHDRVTDDPSVDARPGVRIAGHCVICDRFVVRDETGSCPAGHPGAAVRGRVVLGSGEEPPHLPRLNLGALALPPVWGPAHGIWAGAFFLPIWLFADSAVSAVGRGPAATVAAVAIVCFTAAFQVFFAMKANSVAWVRVCDRTSVETFTRRQRVWAAVCVPLGIALLGWGLYYRFIIA